MMIADCNIAMHNWASEHSNLFEEHSLGNGPQESLGVPERCHEKGMEGNHYLEVSDVSQCVHFIADVMLLIKLT